ncbi:MAG: HAD-IA family hydrolase [Pseudomonadota bacterium]
MRAVLFGSIGTLAETSELQRAAFNAAFAEAGLGWSWSRETYKRMLIKSGGRARIAAFARSQQTAVNVDQLHQRKTEIFQELLSLSKLEARPGVFDTLQALRDANTPISLVTTTSLSNVAQVLSALELEQGVFDVLVHAGLVQHPKPAPDAYRFALETLGVPAGDSLAIEDNPDGVIAAQTAGVPCIALPGDMHDEGAFPTGVPMQSHLDVFSHIAQASAA